MKIIYAFVFFTSAAIGMEKSASTIDLISAIIDANIPMVQEALNNGADSAVANPDGICIALHHKKIAQPREITTPLFLAIYLNSAPIIRLLCAHNPRLANHEENGQTPLTFAAANTSDYTPPVQALLDHQANRNTINEMCLSPFEVACKHNNFKIAALLKQGTNNSAVANGLSFLYRDRDIE
jgi:ankyrin repeat protein